MSYIASFKRMVALSAGVLAFVAAPAFARPAPEGFADLVEDLMPTVVNISTTQTVEGGMSLEEMFNLPEGTPSPIPGLPDFFEQFRSQNPQDGLPRKAQSLGSGFVIDPDGYIVTNNHVIDKAEEISVTFSDDTTVSATVVGRDNKMDLALLKVEVDKKLPYAKFGHSGGVRVGDWVIAIGNPFGLGGSVSAGIISARARDINAGPFDNFLQTDAAINRGNSGGPLFNTRGEVIGINTAIFSPSGGNVGIGFAMPSGMAQPILKQLRETGKVVRGWLGVKIQTVTEEIAESVGLKDAKGALVVDVTKDSPADKAGIKAGDIILWFDGEEVPVMRKLPRMVAETKIGRDVAIRIWRQGKEKPLSVGIGELKEDEQAEEAKNNSNDDNDSKDFSASETTLGMRLAVIDSQLRNKYELDKEVKGLVVTGMHKQSDAYQKGIRPGDVLQSVNQQPLTSLQVLTNAINTAKATNRKSVLLLFNSRGENIFMALPVKEDKE